MEKDSIERVAWREIEFRDIVWRQLQSIERAWRETCGHPSTS